MFEAADIREWRGHDVGDAQGHKIGELEAVYVDTGTDLPSFGTVKVVLYDDREGSSTRGMLNELHFGDHNRAHLVIPPGIWHAMKNVGTTDVIFVNCPTKPYNHEDPDKWSLPRDSGQIPYTF